MDRTAADQVVKSFIHHIDQALNEAACIAKAAKICAETGNLQTAVKMAMDIEDPAYRAQQMLKATLLIRAELLGDFLD
jgi:hypothetical protein